MPAILRNNAAASDLALGRAQLGGGGSGRAPLVRGGGPARVREKARYARDPAAELMPAAEFLGHEPDFDAILEEFEGSPFDPARRKVLGRLAGVFAVDFQGARAEERRFLKRLLLARNAREAYAANRALHLCGAGHAIRRTLALGVAEARFATGAIVPYLGAVQARLAATTLRTLGPEGREAVWNLLTLAGHTDDGGLIGGADPVLERALVLKALGARRHLLGPWCAKGRGALFELAEFAAQLRGARRETLARATTLRAASAASLARLVRETNEPAARAALVARGDIDPIFAWKAHGAPRDKLGGGAGAARGEGEEALPDLDRSPLLDRPRLHQALAEARQRGEALLPSRGAEALSDYLVGRELGADRLRLKDEALGLLAKRGFDVVRGSSVEAIRQDARGALRFDAARAFGDLASRYTGASYVRRVFSDQQTAGGDPLGQIAQALAAGLAVPLTVNELRIPLVRAFAAMAVGPDGATFELFDPERGGRVSVEAAQLIAPTVSEPLGRKARADAYLAPAALDLLAPPFGLAFPAIGIEDRL